jgi:hypothetical protein
MLGDEGCLGVTDDAAQRHQRRGADALGELVVDTTVERDALDRE